MKLLKTRTMIMTWIACTLLMAVSVSAQSPDILKPVESLIDRNTFLVVHIDVEQLDVDKAGESLKKTMGSIIKSLKANDDFTQMLEAQDNDIDETSEMLQARLDVGLPVAKAYLDQLDALGVTDIYVTANSRIMMKLPAQVVIVGNPDNFADVKELLQLEEEPISNQSHLIEKDNMLIVCPVLPTALKNGEVDGADVEKELAKIKPAMRAELTEAIDKSEAGPVRMIFAMDGALKGMLSLALANVPEPFNQISSKTVTDGAKWVSLIADPMNFKASLTVQSASHEAAQNLHNMMLDLAQNQLKMLEDMGMPEEMIEAAREQQQKAQKYMLQVSGDRLVVNIDEKYVVGYVNDVLLPSVISMLPFLTNLGGF